MPVRLRCVLLGWCLGGGGLIAMSGCTQPVQAPMPVAVEGAVLLSDPGGTLTMKLYADGTLPGPTYATLAQ